MANAGIVGTTLREVRVSVTGGASLREAMLYGAKGSDITRMTEIKTMGDGVISRHSVSGIISPTGNTALPVPMRLPLPENIMASARQRVLESVDQLADSAPVQKLTKPGDAFGYPPAGQVWIDRRPLAEVRGHDWEGQAFDVKDPQVRNLLQALHSEQLGRSPFDFHGGDGQAIFH
ncbi:MAG: hypothetical protein H7123_02740 [Thermoleophilia bacterium]|nr:hypothetical protein [Thermoleophilia bacterium]